MRIKFTFDKVRTVHFILVLTFLIPYMTDFPPKLYRRETPENSAWVSTLGVRQRQNDTSAFTVVTFIIMQQPGTNSVARDISTTVHTLPEPDLTRSSRSPELVSGTLPHRVGCAALGRNITVVTFVPWGSEVSSSQIGPARAAELGNGLVVSSAGDGWIHRNMCHPWVHWTFWDGRRWFLWGSFKPTPYTRSYEVVNFVNTKLSL